MAGILWGNPMGHPSPSITADTRAGKHPGATNQPISPEFGIPEIFYYTYPQDLHRLAGKA